VLLSAKVIPQPLPAIFAAMGAISLSFSLSSVFVLEWGPFARLGLGEVERWMVYPILLWLVGFGGYLTASHTAEVSGASRPDTAARSLDGYRGVCAARGGRRRAGRTLACIPDQLVATPPISPRREPSGMPWHASRFAVGPKIPVMPPEGLARQ
jgi:hypothetical protein